MAVEEVEFLENVDEDSQQILVVVGEDGTEVQNLEVIQTQVTCRKRWGHKAVYYTSPQSKVFF